MGESFVGQIIFASNLYLLNIQEKSTFTQGCCELNEEKQGKSKKMCVLCLYNCVFNEERKIITHTHEVGIMYLEKRIYMQQLVHVQLFPGLQKGRS